MEKDIRPALNGQIVDNWFFIGSLSLLILYLFITQSFTIQSRDYLSSAAIYPVLSLFAAIKVTYAGGWLRSKGKSRAAYGVIFAVATGLFVLSIELSIQNFSGYGFL